MTAIDPRISAGGGLDLDAPVTLVDLLDARARRLLVQAARDLGVGVHVVSATGQVIAGNALPGGASDQAGPMLEPIAIPAGASTASREDLTMVGHYMLQALLHEGDRIGYLAVGPHAPEREAAVRKIAGHLAHLVDHLLSMGLEKVYASRMHTASMEDAYTELQHKNARLEQAVDRLQELDKIKSNFLATVSHELRTPLTSVIGYSEMLLDGIAGDLNEEQREYIRTVMEKGEQLLGIITSILDISRIEAGKIILDKQVFPLGDVVEVAISTVVPSARRKGVVVRTEVGADLPPLCADRDKVRQILINLLGNAVKFTPAGGTVVVRAQPAPLAPYDPTGDRTPGRGLRVAVSDTGMGIPPESLQKVFEPFYQVDNTSTRQYGGTGLGLAIVRSFVEAHGGAVAVESAVDVGSTFFVTLPIGE